MWFGIMIGTAPSANGSASAVTPHRRRVWQHWYLMLLSRVRVYQIELTRSPRARGGSCRIVVELRFSKFTGRLQSYYLESEYKGMERHLRVSIPL
jgi:hypothetical protein